MKKLKLSIDEIRSQCLAVIQGDVLNTSQVCRLIRGRGRFDSCSCKRPDGSSFNKNNKQSDQCETICKDRNFLGRVKYALRHLQKDGFVASRKRRWFDWDKNNKTDVFRFWFMDWNLFHEKITKITENPYFES